jgi:ATP-dependent DNA helicase RecQ
VRSQAILLFSDEDAGITDRILAPGASIGEARKIYDDFKKKNKYGGGDFIRTFYFHQNSFLGPEHEARHIVTLLSSIRQRLAESNSLIFAYKPGDGDGDGFDGSPNDWQSEKNLEYAVVRLIILGVVKDYTKDYNSKALSLGLNPDWEGIRDDPNALSEYCADHFRQYVQKYQVNITAKGEQVIRQARAIAEIEKESATSLVAYVYEQIERKRREASRQMLELARKAISDPSGFRQALMLYLQVSEKFTHDLELLANDGELLSWKDLLDRVGTPDEIQELHGACQRVIESYPTHSGLRAISAVTRRNPSADELKRSEEEFDAALKFCAETNKTENAKAMGDTMVEYAERTDVGLTDALQGAFGKWLMKNGFMDEARQRFFIRKPVRDTWIAGVLNDVNSGIPSVRGL